MYIILSLTILFLGSFILSFILKRDYKIKKTDNSLNIKKSPERTIQFSLMAILFINVLFSLAIGKNYEFSWSLLFFIPLIVIVILMIYLTISDYNKKYNSELNFKTKELIIDNNIYSLSDIMKLQINENTRGRSSDYSLNILLSSKNSYEIMRTKNNAMLKDVHKFIKSKIDIQTETTSPKGFFSVKKTIE